MLERKNVLSFGGEGQLILSATDSSRLSSVSFSRGGSRFAYREASLADIDSLVLLEKDVWGEAAATADQIRSRIEVFPGGSWVASNGKELVGYAVCEYIDSLADSDFTWAEITDNGYLAKTHKADGQFVYGVNMSVLPRAAEIGVPQDFFSCLILKDLVFAGKKGFFLGSRIPGFRDFHRKNPDIPAADYARKRNRHKLPVDPELNLYEQLGFSIVRVLPGYFPDPDSEDYGVLVVKTSHTFG